MRSTKALLLLAVAAAAMTLLTLLAVPVEAKKSALQRHHAAAAHKASAHAHAHRESAKHREHEKLEEKQKEKKTSDAPTPPQQRFVETEAQKKLRWLGDVAMDPDETYWDTHDTVVNRAEGFMELYAPNEASSGGAAGESTTGATTPAPAPAPAPGSTTAASESTAPANTAGGASATASASASESSAAELHFPVPVWPKDKKPHPDPHSGGVIVVDNTTHTVFPFETPIRPPGSDRVFPKTRCEVCQSLITAVSTAVIDHSLGRDKTVVRMQTLCQWDSDALLLGIDCLEYYEVEDWLEGGGLLSRQTEKHRPAEEMAAAIQVQKDPVTFCRNVGLCPLDADDQDMSNLIHAAVVRLKLRIDIKDMPRSSLEWKMFVREFLHEVALAAGISSSRLELHVHEGEEIVEIVIREPSAGDLPAEANEGAISFGGNSLRDSMQVAFKLKQSIMNGGNIFDEPNSMVAMVDTSYPIFIKGIRIMPDDEGEHKKH